MDTIELGASKREVLGKRVKALRRQGITPVHVFGHGIKSLALQCDTRTLESVLAEAGRTGLISLRVDGEKRQRTVVAREVGRDWRKGGLLHVDLYQVRMAEKMRVEVPIVLVGEAPVLKSSQNTLDHELDQLAVECLPTKIPHAVEVDVSSLTDVDQVVRVKDVALGEDVVVLNDPELVLVKVITRRAEKAREEVTEAEEAAAPSEQTGPDEG